MTQNESALSPLWVWIQAARPKTLWAAVTPVLVGTALAWHDDVFHPLAAVAALVGAIALQIGANFANDLYDFERGADTEERLGPLRVTQAGLVSPRGMRVALVFVMGLALAVGVYLVSRGGWPIVIVGLSSIAAAVMYTGGPFPYGYHALGEFFVFVFFGVVAVAGTFYVQALTVTMTSVLVSIPMGLLAMAILVVNNLRDIDTDRESGKRTLAVLLGRTGTRIEYLTIMILAGLAPVLLILLDLSGWGTLLASLAIVTAIPLMRTVCTATDGPVLNRVLAQTARTQLIYGILLSIGLNI